MSVDERTQMYRSRAKEWRDRAVALPACEERDAWLEIAAGYDELATLFEQRQQDLARRQ